VTDLPNLAAALAKFQAEVPTVEKARTAKVEKDGRQLYSYTYAGLADVSRVALPLLTRHGLSFACIPEITDGRPVLTGILLHESGESLRGSLPLQTSGRPQDVGSAITYARRYLFGCLTGIVTDDDDDGQAAQRAAKRSERKAERVTSTPPDDPWQDTPPREPGHRQVTAEQLKKIGAQMRDLGMTDRDLALAYVKDVIGREVGSRNDLTRAEASRVIEALVKDAAVDESTARSF